MINLIPDSKRYHFQNEWLSTRWHFSFDHYYDPTNLNFGPLRVFNDDWVQPASGFPTHGHREMEIITYVLEGVLEHKDSTGGSATIGPGEVQRMSAGTGIRHSEFNQSPDVPVHLMQMWIQPAVAGLEPSYEQLQFTVEQRTGRLLPVASGRGHEGTVRIHQDAAIYVARVRPGDELPFDIEAGRRVYVFVIAGDTTINGLVVSEGDQARIEDESRLTIAAATTADLVLIDLP